VTSGEAASSPLKKKTTILFWSAEDGASPLHLRDNSPNQRKSAFRIRPALTIPSGCQRLPHETIPITERLSEYPPRRSRACEASRKRGAK